MNELHRRVIVSLPCNTFFFLVGKIWIFGEVFVEGKEEGREYNMNGSPAVHPKKRQRGRL